MYKLKDTVKKEIVFVGIRAHKPEDAIEDTGYFEIKKEDVNIQNSSYLLEDNTDICSENNVSNEEDPNSEELVLVNCIKNENSSIDYEFLEETKSPKKIQYDIQIKHERNTGYIGQISEDEDYIPPPFLRKLPPVSLNKKQDKSKNKDEDTIPPPNLIKSTICTEILLENYSRSTIIGRCIFTDCIEDCVSLIPRIVRRKMLIEHNTYIPRRSKVCAQHLQDQNWDDISKTTTLFTPDHCQDMKNIVTEASQTNFDFENIDTVDSKLVRYWFNLNKGQFKMILGYFPKLKRLKEPKTAFAVYLMHLQKTSHKRIGLLLRMKERAVIKRIRFVQDLVKCSNFKSLKEKFLEDDD